MTIPVEQLSFIPTGATTKRGLGDWSADMFFNVKNFGAKGDGSTNDTTAIQTCFDAAFGTSGSPHGTSSPGYFSNVTVFFPPGHYIITSTLTLTQVMGGKIFGAGRNVVTIENTATNGSVITTNGFEFSTVSEINFVTASGTGIAFDLDGGASTSSQSNTFLNCSFGGGGAYGLALARVGGVQCSETLVINCYFNTCTTAGFYTAGANACDNIIVGGNIAGCAKGIRVGNGAIPGIYGVSFQNQTSCDIEIANTPTGGGDAYHISGCRSEGTDVFIRCPPAIALNVSGCAHAGTNNGAFIDTNGAYVSITGCTSLKGDINGNTGTLSIAGSFFTRSDYLANWSGAADTPLLRNLRTSLTADLSLKRGQSGTCFDNTGAGANVNVTLPPLNDSGNAAFLPGVYYELYVAVAHEIKFTASNGLKIRDGSSLSAANGKIASSTIGDYLILGSIGPSGDWVVKAKNGTGWVVT